jgi:hypothetical protein
MVRFAGCKAGLKYLQQNIIYQPEVRQRGLMVSQPPPLFKAVFFEWRTKCNGTCSFCGLPGV